MAEHIERELGIRANLVPGALGQFDVEADGEIIASKQKGPKGLANPWPDPDRVVKDLRARLAKGRPA